MNKNINKFKYIRTIGTQSGMTLIEMLVVLAIFMMVSGIVIFDYNKFRSQVSLNNLVDDIASSIRKTQNFAIGVRSSNTADFGSGYGIYFNLNTPSYNSSRNGSNKSFLIFNDKTPNMRYDTNYVSGMAACSPKTVSKDDECMEMFTINTADYISRICAYYDGSSDPTCTSDANGSVAISFLRPDPEAHIYACIPPLCRSTTPADSVQIYIMNTASQDTKFITITNLGQISINS